MPTNPITYAQFGQNFIQKVVTAARINAALAPTMKLDTIEKDLVGQAVTADVEGTSNVANVVLQQDKLPDVWFTVPVSLGFNFHFNALGTSQPYKGTATFSLQMHVQTFDPLTIFLDIPPVTAKDINVVLEAQNLPAGIVQGALEGFLPPAFADGINQKLTNADTIQSRTIDVLQLVNDATSTPSQNAATALTLGAKVQGTLTDGQPQSWTGPLDDNNPGLLTLTVWAKLAADGNDSGVTATLLDSNGGRVGGVYVATNGSTDFERNSATINLPDAEHYTLRLTADDKSAVAFIYTLAFV